MEKKKKPGRPKKNADKDKIVKVSAKKNVMVEETNVEPISLSTREVEEIKNESTGKTLETNPVYNSLVSKEEETVKVESEVNEIPGKNKTEPDKKEEINEISHKNNRVYFTSVWNGIEMDSY